MPDDQMSVPDEKQHRKWTPFFHGLMLAERCPADAYDMNKYKLTQTFWWTSWRCSSVWFWSASSRRLWCSRRLPSDHKSERLVLNDCSIYHGFYIHHVRAYHDSGMWRQRLGVHDEEDDLDEAQGGFDDLSGARRQQQTNIVQQLLPGGHVDGVCETERTKLSPQTWALKKKHQRGNCWKAAVLPLYSNMSRVSANTVQVIMVTEPVSPAYTNTKYWSMASGLGTDTQLHTSKSSK